MVCKNCETCEYEGCSPTKKPCNSCSMLQGDQYFLLWEPKTDCKLKNKEEKTMLVKEEAPMPISEVVRDILNSLEMMDINLHGIESAIMGGDSDEVALKEAAPNRNGLNNDIHLIANAVYNLNNRITALRAIL